MKPGDVVFFKEAKHGSHRTQPTARFKGHGFGLFLGHVPPFQKDPPQSELIKMMAGIGFVTFDEVADLLGEDQAALLVQKFEEKYSKPALILPPETEENLKKIQEAKPSELLPEPAP